MLFLLSPRMQCTNAAVVPPIKSILSKYFSILPELQRNKRLNHKAQSNLIKNLVDYDSETFKNLGICSYRLEKLSYLSKFQIVDIHCPESFYSWAERKASLLRSPLIKSQKNILKIEEKVGTPELNTLKEKKKKSSRNSQMRASKFRCLPKL